MIATLARASGGGGLFGEFKSMCQDISDEIKERRKELAELSKDRNDREEMVVDAGKVVSDEALNRKSSSSASEVIYLDNYDTKNERQRKSLKRSSKGEWQRLMKKAMQSLQDGERQRLEKMAANGEREKQCLDLETRRIECDDKYRKEQRDLSLRRMALEERRAESDDRRAQENAAERRLQLEIQVKMMVFLKKHTDK